MSRRAPFCIVAKLRALRTVYHTVINVSSTGFQQASAWVKAYRMILRHDVTFRFRIRVVSKRSITNRDVT
ncbi:hypothetical protein J6590_011670 [Homalodisca vitripennis]|nr:hypothetical protein J6590_011670 [Homalodisca vitripennis]